MELQSTIYPLMNPSGSYTNDNTISRSIFTICKNYSIIVLDLSVTQDMTMFRTGRIRLESTFFEPLEESIELISLN